MVDDFQTRCLRLSACLLLAVAAAPARPSVAQEDHWLGSVRVKAEPGETVRSHDGPDFTVRYVMRDGRESFGVYEGPAAAVNAFRRVAFRRACGITYYRLSTIADGRRKNVGYYARIGHFDIHIFGDAVSGDQRTVKAFERRLVISRC